MFLTTIRNIRSAFGFFSRIPVGTAPLNDSLKGLLAWLPLVGIVIGAIAGGITYGASLVFPPLIAGLIGCAAWVIVTGGLHLDGVADCGDGLPVEVSPERRLEIMKDSRLGTFGGTFLFFNLGFKFVALSSLAHSTNPWFIITVCAFAGLLARNQMFLACKAPSARPGGMGDAVQQGAKPIHTIFAILLTLAACWFLGEYAWWALFAAIICSTSIIIYALDRLEGVTGDVFGWLIETTEWVVLLIFCIKL